MGDYFGPITPGFLMVIVTMVTQFIKSQYPGFSARQVQLVALILSFIFFLPFHVLTAFMENPSPNWLEIAWLAFSSVVYSIGGWLSAIGLYEVGFKSRG